MRRVILGAFLVAGCGAAVDAVEGGDSGTGSAGSANAGSDGDTTGAIDTSTGVPPAESADPTESTGRVASTSDALGTSGRATDTGSTAGGGADSSGSSADSSGSEEGSSSTGSRAGPEEGKMRVLSYNVAGLPDFISGSDPLVNTPLMSPLLNEFDLVLAQEDFSYHAQLSADAEHPHQSTPGGGGTLGDGLNRFSQSAFNDFEREGWIQCNGLFDSGSDCLTDKGFSVGLHEFGPDAEVDVYNLHMDAGGSQADIAARQAQIQQLLGRISVRSAARAVIVAGDTNMDEEDEADFVTLLNGAGLTDACRELTCGDEFRIDRIMFRSSDTVELTPTSWIVDLSFVDASGEQLSDHDAVVAEFNWAKL